MSIVHVQCSYYVSYVKLNVLFGDASSKIIQKSQTAGEVLDLNLMSSKEFRRYNTEVNS